MLAPGRLREFFIPATGGPFTAEFRGVGELHYVENFWNREKGGAPHDTPKKRALRNPDCFRVCKFPDTGGAELATEAGALYSAERQPRIGRHHRVYENHSRVQFRREKSLFFAIVRPRAGAETECGVVRELDRVVGVPH